MADIRAEALIFSLTCCFLLCSAIRHSPRETHIGYLYDKPGHTLEVPSRESSSAEEDGSNEEVHFPKHPKPHDEYLPPGHHHKGEHEHHEHHEHYREVHNEKREVEKTKKKSVEQHEVASQG